MAAVVVGVMVSVKTGVMLGTVCVIGTVVESVSEPMLTDDDVVINGADEVVGSAVVSGVAVET